MILQITGIGIGFQIFLTVISALGGAAALLWLQTKYHRIKLLKGLESEIQYNLSTVGQAGYSIKESGDVSKTNQYNFVDNIYLALMADTPILYSKLSNPISFVSRAYQQINNLKSLGGGTHLVGPVDEVLKDIESAERDLFRAFIWVRKIQQESVWYRFYAWFWLMDDLREPPNIFTKTVVDHTGAEEQVWRPSGLSSEQLESQLIENNNIVDIVPSSDRDSGDEIDQNHVQTNDADELREGGGDE